MSSEPLTAVLTVRYPSGETEYRTSATTPNVGDVLTRNGNTWIVHEVTTFASAGTVVKLRPGPAPVEPDGVTDKRPPT